MGARWLRQRPLSRVTADPRTGPHIAIPADAAGLARRPVKVRTRTRPRPTACVSAVSVFSVWTMGPGSSLARGGAGCVVIPTCLSLPDSRNSRNNTRRRFFAPQTVPERCGRVLHCRQRMYGVGQPKKPKKSPETPAQDTVTPHTSIAHLSHHHHGSIPIPHRSVVSPILMTLPLVLLGHPSHLRTARSALEQLPPPQLLVPGLVTDTIDLVWRPC